MAFDTPVGFVRRKANKSHICTDCQKPILKGKDYWYFKTAPWENWEGDADDYGKATAYRIRLNHWKSEYYHLYGCHQKNEEYNEEYI